MSAHIQVDEINILIQLCDIVRIMNL